MSVAAAPREVGRTPTVRDRLALQLRRPRPLLAAAWASLSGEAGLLGRAARRRALRVARAALPGAAIASMGTLVVGRAFEGAFPGWARAAGLAVLAAAVAAESWRRAEAAAAVRAASVREQVELGGIFVVAAYAVVQALGAGAAEPALQPLVYLVVAFLVAFLDRRAGLALVSLAAALELGVWRARGGSPLELPGAVAHVGFAALFAVLCHAVLAAEVVAGRRAQRLAVARRIAEIEERAREFRRAEPAAAGGEPGERQRRWTEAAVLEVEAAVRGAVEVAAVALRTHTCAVFVLSDDGERLVRSECRSASGAVVAELGAGEGPLGGAFRRGAPVRLSGEVRAPSHYADGTRPGALLAVPLADRRGGRVAGVVLADRLEAAPFTDEDERLLSTLAAEILRAVAAEKLMDEMKRARDEKERFFAAIERLNRTAKPLEAFDVTLEIARGMAGVDFAAVTLAERREGSLVHRVARVSAGADGRAAALEGLEFDDDERSLVASVVRHGSSLPRKEIDLARTVIFDAVTRVDGIAGLQVVPLRTAEQVLGTLVLGARRPGAFGADLVRQLDVVAMQAADAILRARLFEETERLATTDGLTGLLNHRTFQARLDEHLASAERYGKRLSLVLCDIDHFKAVNDTHGHPAGDEVLRGVARALGKEARQTDLVARYGGEEFALVMPETDEVGALATAERIREKVGQLSFETPQGPLRVTLSLGVATFPEDGDGKAALVERADACLYHAKRNGRNRSVPASVLRAPRRAAG